MLRGVIFLFSMLCILCLTSCRSILLEHYHQGNIAFENCDYHTSLKYYKKAAEFGYAPAQYAVGYQYYYGLGTKRDEPQGITWFQRAAPHDARAEYVLQLLEKCSPKPPWLLGLTKR